MNNIETLTLDWSKKEVLGGKSFDDLFKIEDISLGWFYRKLFLPYNTPSFVNLSSLIYIKKKISNIDKIRCSFFSKILPKFLVLKEQLKFHSKKLSFTKKCKVLFLTYTGHVSENKEIFRLESIIRLLKKDNKLENLTLVVNPLSSKSYDDISGLSNVYHYYSRDLAKKARRLSNKMYSRLKIFNDKAKKDSFRLGNDSLWPYFKYAYNFYFSREFLYLLILYYEIFKKIIEKENVRSIVMTGIWGFHEKCLLAAAKTMKVPVVAIGHAVVTEEKFVDVELLSQTKIVVYNDFHKKRFTSSGVKDKDIVVAGSTIYEGIFPYVEHKNDSNRNILIATNSFVEYQMMRKKDYFKKIEFMIDEISKIKNVNIALKLHPTEIFLNDYQSLIKRKKYDNVKVFAPNIERDEFYKLIKRCNVFIHFGSNSALEAMIIDRPIVVAYILGKKYNIMHFAKGAGAEIEIYSVADIKNAVEIALKDESKYKIKRKEMVKKWAGKIDGKASKNIVKLIYSFKK